MGSRVVPTAGPRQVEVVIAQQIEQSTSELDAVLVVSDRLKPEPPNVASRRILDIRIDATSYEDAAWRIARWAKHHEHRYVAVCSVNNVMEAHDDEHFSSISNGADLSTPDGMPLVWALRRLGVREASRVYGPILTPKIFDLAEDERVPVGFYGGTPEVLEELLSVVEEVWPYLEVAYAYSPPFRPLTPEEDEQVVSAILASGARILFVGIGCPKQERWMAEHRDRLPLVQVGVGAAFDFLAGKKRQAPPLIQRSGLEWVFRLLTEPRRLWRRYLKQNPRFVLLFGWQLIRQGLGSEVSSTSLRN